MRRSCLPPGCVTSTSSLVSGPWFLPPWIERESPLHVKTPRSHLVADHWIYRLEASLQRIQRSWYGCPPEQAVHQICLLRGERVREGPWLPGASHCPCSYLISKQSCPRSISSWTPGRCPSSAALWSSSEQKSGQSGLWDLFSGVASHSVKDRLIQFIPSF